MAVVSAVYIKSKTKTRTKFISRAWRVNYSIFTLVIARNMKRIELVEDCLDLREMSADEYQWLPVTCAYRLLHEGKPLFDWHPLISKKTNSVKRAKMNVTHFAISETTIKDMDDLEDYILKLQS